MVANAVIVDVLTPGGVDAYGDPTDDMSVWSGTMPCLLTRPRVAVTGGDLERDVRDDEAIITGIPARTLAGLIGSGPDWAATSVVIDDRRPGVSGRTRFIVKGFEVAAAGSTADHLRLMLRRATSGD